MGVAHISTKQLVLYELLALCYQCLFRKITLWIRIAIGFLISTTSCHMYGCLDV
jgi:hypothetical protein